MWGEINTKGLTKNINYEKINISTSDHGNRIIIRTGFKFVHGYRYR